MLLYFEEPEKRVKDESVNDFEQEGPCDSMIETAFLSKVFMKGFESVFGINNLLNFLFLLDNASIVFTLNFLLKGSIFPMLPTYKGKALRFFWDSEKCYSE